MTLILTEKAISFVLHLYGLHVFCHFFNRKALCGMRKQHRRSFAEASMVAHALRVPPHELEILAVLAKQELHEMGIIPLMIECHLAADFLTGLSYMIVDICKKHGFSDVALMPEIREFLEKCEKFANALAEMGPELKDLIVNNETLNDALHKKCLGYIKQRLK